LAERDSNINKFTLVRAARIDGDFVLVLRRPDVSALRSNASLADKIEREFGQKVWFAESEASDRRFIENLLHPLKVTAVNQFWLPDGNKLTKVIVSQKVQFDMEKVQKIARAVRGIELLVEFQ
jgi:transcription antitermination factor NusA-like protein